MYLEALLKGIYPHELNEAYRQTDIAGIYCDSRRVKTNSLFVATKGSSSDGANFINQAIDNGASVVVSHKPRDKYCIEKKVCYLTVEDASQFLRDVAKRFYGQPSEKVCTIGITGTNGKTTVAYLIESILHQAKKICGVIGTVNHRIGSRIFPSKNTTPGFLDNQEFLASLVEQNIDYCVMEVSSHALDQGRVDGIDFKQAVFTNLSHEHLDYHENHENYFEAKSKLFTGLSSTSVAAVNNDDPYGQRLIPQISSGIKTYGIGRPADIMAKDIQLHINGSQFQLCTPDGNVPVHTALMGMYNIYNILAAVSVCLNEGIPLNEIKEGIEKLSCVPGRLERVDCGQDFAIFIDYAHTEDALVNVLQAIKDISKGRLILVFGCGGDRDKTKRPLMGRVAGQLADISIVTSDNPRNEDPQSIIDQVVEGFEGDNYVSILDRKEAIRKALGMALQDDVVLLAGKGHEDYQIIRGKKGAFNERLVIEEILK